MGFQRIDVSSFLTVYCKRKKIIRVTLNQEIKKIDEQIGIAVPFYINQPYRKKGWH
jgi:hypothetical protein